MKILSIFLLIIINFLSFGQNRPTSFYLLEENKLNKVTSSNPVSNSITDIIAVGDTVWLGSSRGVSVSFDRGETWKNFYNTSPFGTDNISAIGYNNGVIWVATAKTVEATGGNEVAAGTGLKYTTNNGESWFTVSQPLDSQSDSIIQYGINTLRALPITVPEQNVTFDIAFTPGTVWITSFAGGTRKSTDMGQTWSRVVLPPDYLDTVSPNDTLDFCLSPVAGNFCAEGHLNYRAFAVIAIDDSTLFVGTANGINKSTDNGISWVKFNHQNQNEPISGNFITALAYNDVDDVIWASTWKAEDPSEFYGVSYSTDGGESWGTSLYDERPHNFGFKNFDVIVATDNGPFRSSNMGSSWILPNSIIDKSSNTVLNTNVFYSAAAEGNTIWLGSNDGLAKLDEDFGKIWQGDWKIYIASQPLKSDNETYAYPNPFSPRQEQLKIKYSTGGKNALVTIRIYDFGMNYVRTLIQNAPRNKTIESTPEYWDGRDDNGNLIPNGVYIYRIDIDDNEPLFGKIIVMQ